jgi:uncharacterized damage-inducible protein DinB
MSDVGPPRLSADERETLVAFSRYLRDRVLAKLDGLDDASARRAGVPSGTSLLWLAKHVLGVEHYWVSRVIAGNPESELDVQDLHDDDTIESVLARGEQIAARTEEILRDVDLDASIAYARTPPGVTVVQNNRWVLVHLVEEFGRHAGHADIIREQLDGSVGR